MKIPIQFISYAQKAEETTLIDSGATENFIDEQMVKRLRIGTKKLDHRRTLRNVDGTFNQAGDVTHYCDLYLTRGEKKP